MIFHPLYGRPVEPDVRWPVRTGGATGRIGSFGETRRAANGSPRMHYGIDWIADPGTPIYASHDGKVSRCGEESGGKGYGQRVYIADDPVDREYTLTIYAHMSVQFVTINEFVRAGHCIGLVGRSGNVGSSPTHLHHEVRIGGEGKDRAVDPEWWYHEEVS